MRALPLARLSWNQWRPGLLCLVGFGLIDQMWLRWLRRTAPDQPTAVQTVPLHVGSGPEFYVRPVAATLHLLLLATAFGLCVLLALRRRRSQRVSS